MKKLSSVFLIFAIIILGLTSFCVSEHVKKSVDDNRDDNGDTNEEGKDETLEIADNEPTVTTNTSIPCTRRMNSKVHEIKEALPKQYSFMVAIMNHHDDFLCSGALVSNGLVLTSAQCIQKPISYVMLNATEDNDYKDDTAGIVHIIKTEKFPTYNGPEDQRKDVGIIYTEKHNDSIATKIKVSNFTNSKNMIDLEALGFGLNVDIGQKKELQSVGLEHRPIYDFGDIMKGYFDCIDTKVLTCFRDLGGPVIFDDELVGIVIKGQEDCTKEMSSLYSISKVMVEILPTYVFKPWLDERIRKNEELEASVPLATYPMQLKAARHAMMSATGKDGKQDKPKKTKRSKGERVYSVFLNVFYAYILCSAIM